MAVKTREEHEIEKALAKELIDTGRVTSWAELGRALGISGQAANARLGKGTEDHPGYGLQMPRRRRRFREAVSVSLDEGLAQGLDEIRKQWPGGRVPSKAAVVRSILAERLLGADLSDTPKVP